MHIAIRADASLLIGTGHVMRCLTLAHVLREAGHQVTFVSRELEGNLCDYIEAQGFSVARLPRPVAADGTGDWLGLPWEQDAQQTLSLLDDLPSAAWLIADHYCLDVRWERVIRTKVGHILVIDDLADRQHECDVLLDANLGRKAEDYSALVPKYCHLLIGTHYPLLRREFSEWRERSLVRLRWPVCRILVSMGGVDRNDATSAVLEVLESTTQTADKEIDIIMGQHSPWLDKVRNQAARMQRAHVHVNINNMAEYMANSDLAIGAAGSSSWERCCLGLPTLTIILADNQRSGANALNTAGVQLTIGEPQEMRPRLIDRLSQLDEQAMTDMSKKASTLVDGLGVYRTLEAMHA